MNQTVSEHLHSTIGLPTATVILKPRRARPFFGRHPWVLESAISKIRGEPTDGDVVDLVTHDGLYIARGLWNASSKIRVRLYAFDAAIKLDESLWHSRLESAIALRKSLGLGDQTTAYRLVNSEGDNLSGLIVDRYEEFLSVQITALAMSIRIETICDILENLLSPKGILLRGAERGLSKLEGLHLPDRVIRGTAPDGPLFITENGLRFGIDLTEGQKTGFYLDQRENRQTVARYARGRKVLDMFCYSGGFSLACAMNGHASKVLAVDSSAKATALARANAELNGATTISVETADAFKKLDALKSSGQTFDMVILDPPKFARSRASFEEAMRAYHRINRLAIDLMESGGVLVTNSCSGAVAREDFLMMLAGVAQRSARTIQLLEVHGAASDHPVSVSCLEGEYLKCVIARVV